MGNERESLARLARTLLIELMAYQFASPVRWIETQDAILSCGDCERIIEIGPSNILKSMFKRTIDSKYRTQDYALRVPRQLLSSETDTKKIYYEDEIPTSPKTKPVTAPSRDSTSLRASPLPKPLDQNPNLPQIPASAKHHINEEIVDQNVKATDLIVAIVSRALKKSSLDIDATKSVKDLAGGRSTLENEIVGDLNSEFGTLPDRVEETPLRIVSDSIQQTFNGQLGKASTSMINTMFGSKMPGGFTAAVARKHLQLNWGFKAGRQDSCLLLAVTMQPNSRLISESDAKIFIDDVAEKYCLNEGLATQPLGKVLEGSSSFATTMDPEALRNLTMSQKALSKKLFEVYAADLHLDLDADRQALDKLHNDIEFRLREELNMWTTEHGETYANGIRPLFDIRKSRLYDSSWSWARQDLLDVFHTVSMQLGSKDIASLDPDILAEKCFHIANAADDSLLPIIDELANKLQGHGLLSATFDKLVGDCRKALQYGPTFTGTPKQLAPYTVIDDEGKLSYHEQERKGSTRFSDLAFPRICASYGLQGNPLALSTEPFIHLKEKAHHGWVYSPKLTGCLHDALCQVEKVGENFTDRTVLITGAGIGSIGAAMVSYFLTGGAKVLVTTSSFSTQVANIYREIYVKHGARGSQLIVIPFNQASTQDIAALVDYIYGRDGLGWDLDYLIPFAAISESGRKLDSIDSKSELAHRVMLTNVLRLLGAVKACKEKNKYISHPTQVILPLSPNHGTFGGDGLYGESKLALETLFNRWHSEDWGEFLCVCGAVIGWTRGTGLMNQNDLIAEGIERSGIRTFSQDEMAYALVCLCVNSIYEICQEKPVYADMTGGMSNIEDLPSIIQKLRQELKDRSDIQQALFTEIKFEAGCTTQHSISKPQNKSILQPRPHVRLDFPRSLDYDKDISPLTRNLQGMVDLQRVVVVTGFAELGPHGNSRTRWEIEAHGQFSLEGAIEMAWLMGFIHHHVGTVDGKPYSGWVDSKSKQPVAELDIKNRYEDQILAHSGIRFVEPELFDGYDPNKKQFLHEIILEQDLGPIEVPEPLAQEMQREHGAYANIKKISGSDHCHVRLMKGAKLFVPRAIQFNRTVAGQIPTGWDARTYGISEDIISQVDRVTLFTLVCAAEALLSSGITDPYELYQYIHISEVGNCIGSGFGGNDSLSKMFRWRYMGQDIQKDILQETFINTISAWVNMLLLSANGPIRTPVGACATSIEALELGYDTLVTGKAKFCLVGGCDDFGEESSYEFANMGATSNSLDEAARGRSPSEMSRPATSTRNGFMESQGCGLQVLTTAELALKMGLPIRGIVAFVNTSSDKAGRSIPAPGQGVLTNARQIASRLPSPLLNIENRRKRLNFRIKQVREARDIALEDLNLEVATLLSEDPKMDADTYTKERHQQILEDFSRDEQEARFALGNHFWRNEPYIAPICGALATWGLTIDDLDVASFHGTSTVLNDKNESSVIQQQLASLGRSEGKPIFSVFQKYLTGHSKGAAGAWMLNGALQMLNSGTIPGNRNADNIDSNLQQFHHIAYINRSVQTQGLKAVSVTSFGFGQKGAQAICVHPRYLFATLERPEYEAYQARRINRQKKADAYFYNGMNSNSLFRAKTSPPYMASREAEVYLNPAARLAAVDGKM
ncbi:fatty acid synthase alpha subunit [Uncinocarpus reesii 1704]|uniref:Fatty acid synthase alpha subunit n=1 Tax=Uncinocarpus reesii (strain UAMH 1704) TaxID=336963 RepID=C4JP77_UNCRE|nr:fatty acid synthase alpha subunit [Uncinocarpus reesii 1704]EEP79613.1 fatty acid synthase alpha subunit [Uncinocarpus reesii 1704]